MTKGLNSMADSKGGSTFVDAGSIPVGSTTQRASAMRLVSGMTETSFRGVNTVALLANLGFKPPEWTRRRLRHMAYWRPDLVLAVFGKEAAPLRPFARCLRKGATP